MRKYLVVTAIVLAVCCSLFVWRRLHPPLTDEQQILSSIGSIQAAAEARSPRGIANHLSKDFKIGEISKSQFQNSLAGGILQYRVIDLEISDPQVNVDGSTARSTGGYVLSLKSEYNSPAQVTRGRFDLTWKKFDGEWLITGGNADIPLEP